MSGEGSEVSLRREYGTRDRANLCSKSTRNRFSPEHVRTASMSYLKAGLVGDGQAGGCGGGGEGRAFG